MKQFIIVLLVFLMWDASDGLAQQPFQFTATDLGNGEYQFTADFEPLLPRAGAPNDPFYSYFIDFGDGNFKQGHMPDNATSFSIIHQYDIAPTEAPMLRGGGNYSKTKRPPDERIAPGTIGGISAATGVPTLDTTLLNGSENTSIHPTFIPKSFPAHGLYLVEPEDDLALVLSYRNFGQAGHLVLMYNEAYSPQPHLQPNDEHYPRMYFGEDYQGNDISNINMPAVANSFNDFMVWEISEGEASDQEQRIFADFHILETEEADNVNLAIAFIPTGAAPSSIDVNNLTLSVTSSRDPNELIGEFNGELFSNSSYTYQVHFFNESNGAANDITIKAWDIFKNWNIDTAKVKIKTIKVGRSIYSVDAHINNFCELSAEDDTLIFDLNGVYLEGLASPLLQDVRDAFGYIEFELEPHQGWRSTKGQAYIIFDTNEPIYTNEELISVSLFNNTCFVVVLVLLLLLILAIVWALILRNRVKKHKNA